MHSHFVDHIPLTLCPFYPICLVCNPIDMPPRRNGGFSPTPYSGMVDITGLDYVKTIKPGENHLFSQMMSGTSLPPCKKPFEILRESIWLCGGYESILHAGQTKHRRKRGGKHTTFQKISSTLGCRGLSWRHAGG